MARTGIARIDQLLDGQRVEPIGPGDPDQEAVGVIQDLLIGHGFRDLPGLLDQARGRFGPRTTDAVRTFQRNQGLQESGLVDRSLLQTLVTVPAARPLASHSYLTLVLDFIFTGMTRLLSLTTQFAGAGHF